MTTDTRVDVLEARGLIRLASIRPELEYLFRHGLVQDAAYTSLLKQERRELHGRVGAALEELYPDRAGELAPVLAMHFEQAGDAERAIDYYVAGAKHALEQYAVQEAFGAFDRAASLIAEEEAAPAAVELSADEANRRRRRRIEVDLGRAEAGYSFRTPEETFDALGRIVEPAEQLGDLELVGRVHTLIALERLQNGEPATDPTVKRSLDRIAEVGKSIGDPSLLAVPLALIGLGNVFAGDVRLGVTQLEEALPLMQGRQDTIGPAFARGALAIGYANLGEFKKADAAAAQATALAGKSDLIAQLDALIAESLVHSLKGELDRAIPLARKCVLQSAETGATACMIASSWILGDAFYRQGNYAEAQEVLKRGSDISAVVDRKVWRPTLLAWLGSTMAALGAADEGDWEEALATARSIGNRVGEAGILAKRAEAFVTRGDIDAARPDAEAAIGITAELGLRPHLARVQRAWGEALRAAGLATEAEPHLQKAATLFDELGLDAEAKAVRAELAMGEMKIAFD
jgi:tetratricopeptide (TPR) repeat protein